MISIGFINRWDNIWDWKMTSCQHMNKEGTTPKISLKANALQIELRHAMSVYNCNSWKEKHKYTYRQWKLVPMSNFSPESHHKGRQLQQLNTSFQYKASKKLKVRSDIWISNNYNSTTWMWMTNDQNEGVLRSARLVQPSHEIVVCSSNDFLDSWEISKSGEINHKIASK